MLLTVGARSMARYGAVMMAVGAWYSVASIGSRTLVYWSGVEATLAAFVLPGAVLGVLVGALDWQLVWRRASECVPLGLARSVRPIWLLWGWSSFWLLLGGSMGTLVGLLTVSSTVVGEPNWWMLASVGATVPVAVGFGLIVGHAVRSTLGSLLVAGVTYGLLGMLLYGGGRWSALAPIAEGAPALGWAISTQLARLQTTWLLLLGVGLVAVMVALAARRNPGVAGAVIVVAGLVGVAATSQEQLEPVSVPQACASFEPEVCGPDEVVNNVVDEVSQTAGIFADLSAQRLATVEISEQFGRFLPSEAFVNVYVYQMMASPKFAVASTLVQPFDDTCRNVGASRLVADAVVHLVDPQAPSSPLARTLAERLAETGWLIDNLERLHQCQVTVGEVMAI